jgi:hypothetical protein
VKQVPSRVLGGSLILFITISPSSFTLSKSERTISSFSYFKPLKELPIPVISNPSQRELPVPVISKPLKEPPV